MTLGGICPGLWPLLVMLAGPLAEAAPPPAAGSPHSAACGRALAVLREAEDHLIAAPRERTDAMRPAMLQARRAAALACLGEPGDEALPHAPRTEAPAPVAAHGTAVARPESRPAAAPPAAPLTPRTLGACDANGCWTSDGVRLQRVGPQLLGPNGFCSTTGASVQCP